MMKRSPGSVTHALSPGTDGQTLEPVILLGVVAFFCCLCANPGSQCVSE